MKYFIKDLKIMVINYKIGLKMVIGLFIGQIKYVIGFIQKYTILKIFKLIKKYSDCVKNLWLLITL